VVADSALPNGVHADKDLVADIGTATVSDLVETAKPPKEDAAPGRLRLRISASGTEPGNG
jgi:hypothetical protein